MESILRGVLTEREAEVIKFRLGLPGDKRYTLREIGDIFKLSPERIRQIEAKALRKLESFNKKGELRSILLKKGGDLFEPSTKKGGINSSQGSRILPLRDKYWA